MSISNIVDYMSFFFIAKYVNSSGISARNVAPDFEDKKDIYSKAAKLINSTINLEFAKYKFPKKLLPEEENVDKNTLVNTLFGLHDAKVNFQPLKRVKSNNQNTLSSYCQYKSTSTLDFNLLSSFKDFAIPITEIQTKNFFVNLLTGVDVSNPVLFRAVYPGSYYSRHVNNFTNSEYIDNLKMFLFKKPLNVRVDNPNHIIAIMMSAVSGKNILNSDAASPFSYEMVSNGINHYSYGGSNPDDIISPDNYSIYYYNVNAISRNNTRTDFVVLDNMKINDYYSPHYVGIIHSCLVSCLNNEDHKLSPKNIEDIKNLTFQHVPANISDEETANRVRHSLKEKFFKFPASGFYGKYIHICRLLINHEYVYFCMTNVENVFEERAKVVLTTNFRVNNNALTSSENFKNAMLGLNESLNNYFEKI